MVRKVASPKKGDAKYTQTDEVSAEESAATTTQENAQTAPL
jgi:hypothetical protein